MIIKGKPAGNVGFWSKHLLKDRADVKEIRGTIADNLPDALREMEAVASGSRCKGNFMYQANINPYAHEHLSPAQWQKAVDTLEKNLRLEGHQRVVVEHIKDGRQHYHVIWNRVDVDTMRVRDITGNYYNHERTARQLEAEFGLERPSRVLGEREGPRTSRPSQFWEHERGKESGLSPNAIKAEITELWRQSDTGRTFVTALEERGYILAKGDRRDFCVIDRAGDEHSLARRLDGVTAKGIRERLAGIDRDSLPTVDQAKEQQRERLAERATAPTAEHAKQPQRERPAEKAKPHKHQAEPEILGSSRATAKQAEAAVHGSARAGLQVFDAVTKTTDRLVDFVAALLDGFFVAPQPKRSSFERLGDDPGARAAEIKAQRRAKAALENIRESIERGDRLSASDVRHLTPQHLMQIHAKGDDGVRELIEQAERDQERQRDRGRERER